MTTAFAPVSRFVALQGRGRVTIAAPEVWSGFGPLFGAPKDGQVKGGGRKRPAPPTSVRSADSFEENTRGSFGQKISPQGVDNQKNRVITG